MMGLLNHGSRPLSIEVRTAEKSKRMIPKLSGPACWNPSITDVRIPVMSAASMTTTPTPIATPRIVRLERTLLALIELRPIRIPSLSVVTALISISLVTSISLVPQGVHGGELRGPHGGV